MPAREGWTMNHMDLVAVAAGILITVGSIVLGAWLDLRPSRRDQGLLGRRETRGESAGRVDNGKPAHRAPAR